MAGVKRLPQQARVDAIRRAEHPLRVPLNLAYVFVHHLPRIDAGEIVGEPAAITSAAIVFPVPAHPPKNAASPL
jgi:hypothetical protein